MATKDVTGSGIIASQTNFTKDFSSSGYVIPEGFSHYRAGAEIYSISGNNDFEIWRGSFTPLPLEIGRFLLLSSSGYIGNDFFIEFLCSAFCILEKIKECTATGVVALPKTEIAGTGIVSIPDTRLLPRIPLERLNSPERFPSIP